MEEAIAHQKVINTSKAYHFMNIEELITITNSELEDIFYIGKNKHERNYRWDFSLKTQQEVMDLHKKNTSKISHTGKEYTVFVYNERTEEAVPFKENDCIMYDRGYVSFDGKKYYSYDDNGNEVGFFPGTKKAPISKKNSSSVLI